MADRLTAKQKVDLVKDSYDSGLSLEETAAKHRVGYSSLTKWRSMYNSGELSVEGEERKPAVGRPKGSKAKAKPKTNGAVKANGAMDEFVASMTEVNKLKEELEQVYAKNKRLEETILLLASR